MNYPTRNPEAPEEVAIDMKSILANTPLSMRVHESQYEGRQDIISIRMNIEDLYGVGCVIEFPFMGKDRPEPFPSREIDYVPLDVSPETSMEMFLDAACSEGQIQWEMIRNAVHIWPTSICPGKEVYLDTVLVSLDLDAVSLLDAAKEWATEVNRNRDPSGYGIQVSHSSNNADRIKKATPASFTCPGSVTLKVQDVTAREALCAIQGASKEWVSLAYMHMANRADVLILFPQWSDAIVYVEITPEERAMMDAQEDLGSVLVEPTKAQE